MSIQHDITKEKKLTKIQRHGTFGCLRFGGDYIKNDTEEITGNLWSLYEIQISFLCLHALEKYLKNGIFILFYDFEP